MAASIGVYDDVSLTGAYVEVLAYINNYTAVRNLDYIFSVNTTRPLPAPLPLAGEGGA